MTITELSTREEFLEAVELQARIWGYTDRTELLPLRFFVVASKIGGQVLGAWAEENGHRRMVGFLLAIPGVKDGVHPYLHSHMMGVVEEFRNAGLGRAMKLRQKEIALERGFDLVEWTFDPLQIKNAYFNIEGLGVICRRYQRNLYGRSSSALQGNLPTDRLVAEWRIREERPRPAIAHRIFISGERSESAQAAMAQEFERAFAAGLAVCGLERKAGGADYLLGQIQ